MKNTVEKRIFAISIIAVMAVYLPTIYQNCLSIDDNDLLNRLTVSFPTANYFRMFVPLKSVLYYRPMLEVTYHLDYAIWGSTIGGFHITNYLLHVLNAVLLYFAASKILCETEKPKVYAAVAMLLFALNPITCESVAWISGRSDIVGTFFSLLAVNCYFFKRPLNMVLVPVFALLGMCGKENALAIVPLVIFLHAWLMYKRSGRFNSYVIRSTVHWIVIMAIPVIIYVLLRTMGGGGFEKGMDRIATAASDVSTGAPGLNWSGYYKIFPAIAFYLKKLFIPYPLNFSIATIHYSVYGILFVLLVVANTYWALKRRFQYVIICGLLVISFLPAIPIAVGGVAWVPFAERYLYLSLCVWGLSISYLMNDFAAKGRVRPFIRQAVIVLIVVVFSISTLIRQSHWQNNQRLMKETAETNPENYQVLFNYGVSSRDPGRIEFLRKAEEKSSEATPGWRANLYRAIAYYYVEYNIKDNIIYKVYDSQMENEPNEKNAYALPEMTEKEISETVIYNLDHGLSLDSSYRSYKESAIIILKLNPEDEDLRKIIFTKARDYYSEAYRKKHDPFDLYKMGNLEKILGHHDKAVYYFKELIHNFPESHYAQLSEKRLKKLEQTDSNQQEQ